MPAMKHLQTLSYTGLAQTYTIPNNVKRIFVELRGAHGAYDNGGGASYPGITKAEFDVTPGEQLTIYVGGFARTDTYSRYSLGGWNGGANGGANNYTGGKGGGGGGASDIRRGGIALTDRIIVAGGGGGYGDKAAGNAGGTVGSDAATSGGGYAGGKGGTQSAGGAAGAGATAAGAAGVFGVGGAGKGDSLSNKLGGGGGGGGYWGGGGGGQGTTAPGTNSSGGGGSSFVATSAIVDTAILAYKGGPGWPSFFTEVGGRHGEVIISAALFTPDPPVLIVPKIGEVIDRRLAYTFKWSFIDQDAGDAQSAYDLQYRAQGTTPWTTVSAGSTSPQSTIAANTFAIGNWEWRVRTADNGGSFGPYSSIQTFQAGEPPAAPSITAPTLNQEITQPDITITWTTSANGEQEVRIVADSGGNPYASTLIAGVETVPSGTTSKTLPLTNSGNYYHAQVRVKDTTTLLWSAWASRRFLFNAARPPAPTVDLAIAENTLGRVAVHVIHPTAVSPDEPAVKYEIYKRILNSGSEWDLVGLATTGSPANTIMYDYNAAHGFTYEYKARDYSAAGGFRESLIVPMGTPLFLIGTWIHDIKDPEGTVWQFLANQNAGDETWEADATLVVVAGRTLPVSEYGENEMRSISVTIQFDGTVDRSKFKGLMERKAILCMRDKWTRMNFGVVRNYNYSPTSWGGYGTFTLEAVDS